MSQIPQIDRVNVLGVGISVIDMDKAWVAVRAALEEKEKGYICVTGVHGVSEAQTDADFRAILNKAYLNTPDGVPMVWMGKMRGKQEIARVYGPDLMLKVFAEGEPLGLKHFFYGGKEGVVELLEEKLVKRFPQSRIVGKYTPPFRPLSAAEESELISQVADAQPDIIWVGLSTPKQERFMTEYLERLDTTLMFGVGAAFDFHAGLIRQAPRWMQNCGLEWFFRLCQEPRRLGKRYLKNNPLFVLRIIGQLIGLR